MVQPKGNINLLTGIRIAHLVLKHRQGKHHKMRIVVFVGSPIKADEADLVKLAKRLKKEKVNVDVVSFGNHNENNELLTAFVNALNGKDGTGSHLVSVPRGSAMSEALISSPIIQGEDGTGGAGLGGAGFEFGVDPNEDPELALALRVSMEEQRARQEEEQRRAQANSAAETSPASGTTTTESSEPHSEEAMLQRALALSTDTASNVDDGMPDFANMTEEEQIAFAMQMSMQDARKLINTKILYNIFTKIILIVEESTQPKAEAIKAEDTPMEVDEDNAVITDPAFLQVKNSFFSKIQNLLKILSFLECT